MSPVGCQEVKSDRVNLIECISYIYNTVYIICLYHLRDIYGIITQFEKSLRKNCAARDKAIATPLQCSSAQMTDPQNCYNESW
jgi:hypothetical protein